jgi:hypothetical protein
MAIAWFGFKSHLNIFEVNQIKLNYIGSATIRGFLGIASYGRFG